MARSEMLWRCFCSLCTSQLALPAAATGPLHHCTSEGRAKAALELHSASLHKAFWASAEPQSPPTSLLSSSPFPEHLCGPLVNISTKKKKKKEKYNVLTKQLRSSSSLKLTISWTEHLVIPHVCCATRDSKVVALGNVNHGLEPSWVGRTLQNLLHRAFSVWFTFTVEDKSSSPSHELESKTPTQAPALPNVTFWASHVIQSILCLTLFLPSYGGWGAKSGSKPTSTGVI